jgi:superfamily I DNA and RNA helicase
MKHTSISDQQDMKKQVLRYVNFSTEQIWKTFLEFLDDNKTYENFKVVILVHYPDASGDFIYSIRDMDLLIGERQC